MNARDIASFHGIYPSVICPFKADYSIDEPALAKHIEEIIAVPGIVGVLCNGHAGEAALLRRAERRRVAEIACEVTGRRSHVVVGINCEDSQEAGEHALDAAAAGADAIMVFPPYSWALSQDGEMALNHHNAVRQAASLPIMLFQGSIRSGRIAYTSETLKQLVQISDVIAIKEGSWEVAAYEMTRRLVKEYAPQIAVMASGDQHLFASYVLGSEGSLVSLAIVMPSIIVALDEAVRRSDLAEARRLHEKVYPVAQAIYGTPPEGHANARLKTCLKLLGHLRDDRVRLPIGPLSRSEIDILEQALESAGLL